MKCRTIFRTSTIREAVSTKANNDKISTTCATMQKGLKGCKADSVTQSCRADSVAKSSWCFCREPKFCSQHPVTWLTNVWIFNSRSKKCCTFFQPLQIPATRVHRPTEKDAFTVTHTHTQTCLRTHNSKNMF